MNSDTIRHCALHMEMMCSQSFTCLLSIGTGNVFVNMTFNIVLLFAFLHMRISITFSITITF